MKMPMSYTVVNTELGWIGIVGSKAGLCAITLPQASLEAALFLLTESLAEATPDESSFGDLPQRLQRWAAGERVLFPDKLDFGNATPFQGAVWQVTRSIPYGETRSYGFIAQQIGKLQAARAVGQALAANPLPIVIPCHRVIGSDGDLCGFGGGLEMKKHLLKMEVRGNNTG